MVPYNEMTAVHDLRDARQTAQSLANAELMDRFSLRPGMVVFWCNVRQV